MNASVAPRPPEGAVAAILTAAGSGTRLGAGGPKALVPVGGISLLRRAAGGLLDSGVVDGLIITAPPDDVDRFRREMAEVAGAAEQPVEVVAGSAASRQASVALGLEAVLGVMPTAQVVLVHDAARALTPPEVIRRVVAAVRAGHGAVVPALPVSDTIKEVGPVREGHDDVTAGTGGGVEPVVATPSREPLRAVQTPQGFALGTLLEAHRLGAGRSQDEAAAASDDAGLVEAAGGSVVVVPGDQMALKITTPTDLALAEVLVGRSY
ncbi:IspD/TarI family cytidylyltransferase [Actinomyces capricornis]|uniref:2-C-methyl-D-erythritol 4-phosphate cytidylyltransferase n=1 Tax=Actinomyces capricornis TaxID=2755559 RepID=A0ABN6K4K1_9ACTO|nr:IspD/TarI family cytidylyltransferase [Actinomyces capricornis]BDA64544.1 2-C-methyl-D-erythritol 4-phosphate cytidylyltransferase [Actinomyces capricornis]